jgi:hypothetical protein
VLPFRNAGIAGIYYDSVRSDWIANLLSATALYSGSLVRVGMFRSRRSCAAFVHPSLDQHLGHTQSM